MDRRQVEGAPVSSGFGMSKSLSLGHLVPMSEDLLETKTETQAISTNLVQYFGTIQDEEDEEDGVFFD